MTETFEQSNTLDLQFTSQSRMQNEQQSINKNSEINKSKQVYSVKNNIAEIEAQVDQFHQDLKESQQQIKLVRSQMKNFQEENDTLMDEIMKVIGDEKFRVSNTFQTLDRQALAEIDFLDSQLNQDEKDWGQLSEAGAVLMQRVENCEEDVGFRFIEDVEEGKNANAK